MIRRMAISALGVTAVVLVGAVVHEGYSDEPYLDSVGVLTIGPGRTEGVKPGEKTTVQRELVLMLKDMEGRKAAIEKCVTVPLYQHELDAYISLAYNIGTGAFCGSTLVRKLNAGDYAGACREILRWNRAGGKDCNVRANNCYGIVERRQAEYRTCTNLPAAGTATADAVKPGGEG